MSNCITSYATLAFGSGWLHRGVFRLSGGERILNSISRVLVPEIQESSIIYWPLSYFNWVSDALVAHDRSRTCYPGISSPLLNRLASCLIITSKLGQKSKRVTPELGFKAQPDRSPLTHLVHEPELLKTSFCTTIITYLKDLSSYFSRMAYVCGYDKLSGIIVSNIARSLHQRWRVPITPRMAP